MPSISFLETLGGVLIWRVLRPLVKLPTTVFCAEFAVILRFPNQHTSRKFIAISIAALYN